MFDVNSPDTMQTLTKWWGDFCACTLLEDEEMADFCCVVVGNKIDANVECNSARVTEAEALGFVERLVHTPYPSLDHNHLNGFALPGPNHNDTSPASPLINVQQPEERSSPNPDDSFQLIDPIAISSPYTLANGIARRTSCCRDPHTVPSYNNTLSSIKSGPSRYYTPSSSLFEQFDSALSSPHVSPASFPEEQQNIQITRRRNSNDTTSSNSAATLTPSLFARENLAGNGTGITSDRTTIAVPDDNSDVDQSALTSPTAIAAPLYRGPKLFFTSAKTGEGVSEVFEYIAHRVVHMREYEEQVEARRLHIRESSSAGTIYLQSSGNGKDRKWNCCST
ncbi:hypothetical protein AX15_004172 [Amanita polypyramis BW_CC]|nr:hypothetical protein AX15_004172 [Amanita polypyramis BW_CC]